MCWVMPSARANRARYARLPLANQALSIPIAVIIKIKTSCRKLIIWAMFLVFVVIFIWAMPSARANRARLRSVAFGEPSPTYPYRIFLFCCFLVNNFSSLVELFFGRYLSGPGCFGTVTLFSFGEQNIFISIFFLKNFKMVLIAIVLNN